MNSNLTNTQAKLLQKGLDEVEILRAQKATLDTEIQEWMTTLQSTFGESAVYTNGDGRKIQWSLAHTKRTSHKKVLDKVREEATPSLARFIDAEREAHTKESVQRKLTATKGKKGKKNVPATEGKRSYVSVSDAQARAIKKKLAKGASVNSIRAQYGASVGTVSRIRSGAGRFANL